MLFFSGVDYPPGERVMRHPDRNIDGDISALSFLILSKTLRPAILLVHPREGSPAGMSAAGIAGRLVAAQVSHKGESNGDIGVLYGR